MKIIKKCLHIALILGLLFAFFCVSASASSSEKREDELIGEFEKLLPDGSGNTDVESVISHLGADALLSEVYTVLSGRGGEILSFLLLLLGTSVLIILARIVPDAASPIVRPALCAVGSFAILLRVLPLVREVADGLLHISSFFGGTLPLITSAVALGGGSITASTSAVGMSLTLGACSLFSEKVLLLLVFAMFTSAVAGCFGGASARLFRSVRTVFVRGLTLLSTVFVGLLSLQTLISGVADGMTMRAARYAATSMIPMVGGTVAGALSTVMGGAAYAKGIIGGGAVAVILSLAIAPLVMLLGYKLCFFLATSLLELCSADEGASCLRGLSDALDALIAVFAVSVMLCLLEIAVLMAVGINPG